MEKCYVLWGRKENEPEWLEECLCETPNKEKLDEVEKVAKEKGYVHFRRSTFDGYEMPDFTKTIKTNN